MIDPRSIPATRILAIPLSEPELLFSDDDVAKQEYRALAKHWFPDLNKDPDAGRVTAHLNALYDSAEKKINSGTWHAPGLMKVTGIDGKSRKIRYRKRHDFELGTMLYGDGIVAHIIKQEFADHFESARRIIKGLEYRHPVMEKEISPYLPTLIADFESVDNHFIMVMKKTSGIYLLRDVLNFFHGSIDPRHVAWVTNCVYNLLCYFSYASLTHNGLSPDTIFISPEHHSAYIFGGWWYACPEGARMNALPKRYHDFGAPDVIRNKKADVRLDLTMIRALGRELLGDVTGMNLSPDIPSPIRNFLKLPAGEIASADYEAWGTALQASYGKRRFHKMVITDTDIFN